MSLSTCAKVPTKIRKIANPNSATVSFSEANAATLRQRVTSPGGTTEAALNVFQKQAVSDSIVRAVQAAVDRARDLAKSN